MDCTCQCEYCMMRRERDALLVAARNLLNTSSYTPEHETALDELERIVQSAEDRQV